MLYGMGNVKKNCSRIYKNGKVNIVDYKKQGAANRKKGAAFELKVRKDLENSGNVVVKNQNNIDLDKKKFVAAKQKFIGGRGMGLGSGFPDFIAFNDINRHTLKQCKYHLIFVEAKFNGMLSVIEKQKMNWLIKEGHLAWIAYNENGKVKYRKFVEYKKYAKVCRE